MSLSWDTWTGVHPWCGQTVLKVTESARHWEHVLIMRSLNRKGRPISWIRQPLNKLATSGKSTLTSSCSVCAPVNLLQTNSWLKIGFVPPSVERGNVSFLKRATQGQTFQPCYRFFSVSSCDSWKERCGHAPHSSKWAYVCSMNLCVVPPQYGSCRPVT
jgi:hypothetical protein